MAGRAFSPFLPPAPHPARLLQVAAAKGAFARGAPGSLRQVPGKPRPLRARRQRRAERARLLSQALRLWARCTPAGLLSGGGRRARFWPDSIAATLPSLGRRFAPFSGLSGGLRRRFCLGKSTRGVGGRAGRQGSAPRRNGDRSKSEGGFPPVRLASPLKTGSLPVCFVGTIWG